MKRAAAALWLAACVDPAAPPVDLVHVDCLAHTATREVAAPSGGPAAAALLWDAYGMADEMPPVHWVPGWEFTGPDADRTYSGVRCIGSQQESLWVAIQWGRPSETFLAHEMTHAVIAREHNGWFDGDHVDALWCGIEPLNAWLASEGF